jgi:chromosome segregation ATPase
MIELPLLEYCKIVGLSRQHVTKQLKNGILKSRKDSTGHVFILLDVEKNNDINTKSDSISELKTVIGAYVADMREIIKRLEDKNVEIIKLKDSQLDEKESRITDLKEEISSLKDERKELLAEIKKLNNRGFFDRLFGD